MSALQSGSTEAVPLVIDDDQENLQERMLALERRENLATEAEQLAHDSGCRILMDGKMVPVFTLTADASCASLEDPAALATREELESILLRICSVSQVARTIATQMLPTATTQAASTSGSAGGSKRKAPDAETIHRCSHCKLRFETDENLPKDCRYHPGRKEVDEEAQRSDDDIDFWADHEEDCHGIKETLTDDPTCDGGFVWSCCE